MKLFKTKLTKSGTYYVESGLTDTMLYLCLYTDRYLNKDGLLILGWHEDYKNRLGFLSYASAKKVMVAHGCNKFSRIKHGKR